jgi:hypothetical protein
MVLDDDVSINDAINTLFKGQAYAIDKKNMTLALYVWFSFDTDLLRYIINQNLLPSPPGVRYAVVARLIPGETFGFRDNASSKGFADKFDRENQPGGVFAQKFII